MPRVPRSTSRVRPPVWRDEVEAQRQRVQVAEHLERDVAHRALRHLGEQELAQLGEQRRRQPQQAVGDEQRERHGEQRGLAVEGVDDLLQQHRDADVGDLGGDQRGQRRDHPPLVRPEVGQQRADGAEVAARCAARRRVRRGGVAAHVVAGAGVRGSRRQRGIRGRPAHYRAPAGPLPGGLSAASDRPSATVSSTGRGTTRCRRSPGGPSRPARSRRRSR